MSLARASIAGISLIVLFVSCSTTPVQPPEFDGERTFGYLEQQVAFGPRVPGSEASAKARDYFYRYFEEVGLETDSQAFPYLDPYSGQSITMVNVIASFRPEGYRGKGIVLMAHYDCRPRTDFASEPELAELPIDGANDGASGVAVLMEMANLFATQPPPRPVDLVLVDGEDWGKVCDHANYLIGSREFARRGVRDKYIFGIVVDLIGDSDQLIFREAYSERYAKKLNDMVWSTAARLNVPTFVDSVKYVVVDDHLSLNISGVPAVNIIDMDYGYWHTEFDTPDKCSPESLTNVGKVVADIVYNPSIWPISD
jgi:hypothetical protein